MNLSRHYYSPHNQLPFLYVLYQYDCLHAKDMARLLNMNSDVVSRYMKALEESSYVKSYRHKSRVYWHLVTDGIAYLEMLLEETLPIHYGTGHPSRERKQKLRHDLHGTLLAMSMVEHTVPDETGLITWIGPTLTKTLYPKSMDNGFVETIVPFYNPDLYLEYVCEGQIGCLNVEIDASKQTASEWKMKVQKSRVSVLMGFYRSTTDWLTIAFVTLRGEQFLQNTLATLVDEFVGHVNPVLVVATTFEQLSEQGPYAPIWLSNDGTDTKYALKDLTILEWNHEERPLLIGTNSWLDALKGGRLNLYTYANPWISKVQPWNEYIPQEERRAARLQEKLDARRNVSGE